MEDKIDELESRIEELEEEVEEWQNKYYELEEKVTIKDFNHFIWRLKADNLYTDELDMFINDYMKFYNI